MSFVRFNRSVNYKHKTIIEFFFPLNPFLHMKAVPNFPGLELQNDLMYLVSCPTRV